jgi:hypothetical protein
MLSGVSIQDGVPTFGKPCHELAAGDRVVFTGQSNLKPLCGLSLNEVYHVIASNLSANEFRVSTESNGSPLVVDGNLAGELFYSKPIDLAGYSIDSDIVTDDSSVQVATFTSTVIDPEGGGFELELQPNATRKMIPGDYRYDVTLISPGGKRYYCLLGIIFFKTTFSRV